MPVVIPEENKAMLENGTYEVKLLAMEEDFIEDSQYDPDVYRWTFEVVDTVDSDGKAIHMDPISSQKITPMSKFWSWAVALGGQPVIGQPFDTDVLVGKHAMAKVQAKLKSDGTKGFPKIVDLMAMPKGSSRKGSTRAQEGAGAPGERSPVSDFKQQVKDAGKKWVDAVNLSMSTFDERTPEELTGEELAALYAKLLD